MRKRRGKTTAKVSHVSNSEALSTSIRKFQIKCKNGHGLNEDKQEGMFVKTAFEMTKLKHTHTHAFHKRESVPIGHWQFPSTEDPGTHTGLSPDEAQPPGFRQEALHLIPWV